MKNKKLWGGRFAAETAERVDAFNASVGFDWRLYADDIHGSIAHARMLGRQKIISSREATRIVNGLKKILGEIEANHFHWDTAKEDVHLNIESRLTSRIGPAGGKLHTARSRNDQVATDLRLHTRGWIRLLASSILHLQAGLVNKAAQYENTLLPGYTHMQRAQPVTLAHYLLAYFEMLRRDFDRLLDSLPRINVLPLGSGALAGTTFPIDRRWVAGQLGFSSVSANSLDAVSDRDFVIETLSNLALVMMHLSRLSEEWIIWATQEFQFIILPEGYCTGSSMMPQKINPDVLELIRGKTGRVYGSLMALLTILKGLPLAYNKDLQEDKEPFFDALKTAHDCLAILGDMVPRVEFDGVNMKRALAAGYVLATDVADYLASKGMPFRDAHRIVGEIVAFCQRAGKELKDLSLAQWKKFDKLFDKDLFDWLDEEHAVDRRSSIGGTSRRGVRKAIAEAKSYLKKSTRLVAQIPQIKK